MIGAAVAVTAAGVAELDRRHRREAAGPLPYERFKADITFGQVRAELKAEQQAAYERSEYMHVGRSTVLGRMKQRKEEAYADYLREWEKRHGEGAEPELGEKRASWMPF